VQVGLGSLGPSDAAFSVLATVISTRPEAGQIVVDAGGLALSKDRGDGRWGYGLVLDIDGVDRLGGVTITDVHQEHGEIRGLTPAQAAGLAVGTKVRILPNHVCMTAAMYDELLVCDGQRLVGRWPRTNGWRER
jgi:D-serine deaminase-like pyridoxal phosphate-dependent protein